MRPLAKEEHRARPGREDAEAAGEQRRLAAARRAEQPVDAAAGHVERQPVQHGRRGLLPQAAAVAEAHVVEHDRAHALSAELIGSLKLGNVWVFV